MKKSAAKKVTKKNQRLADLMAKGEKITGGMNVNKASPKLFI